MVIALGAVLIAHLVGPAGKPGSASPGGQAGNRQSPGPPGGQRPEFYLTATYPASGPNVLQFKVRRTDGGAVTASTSISAANLGWGGNLTVAAGDRAFYIGEYQCIKTATPHTTFYRITITSAGRISGMATAGPSVEGMVTTLAVSPDGSQMAYSAVQHACAVRLTRLQAIFEGDGEVNVTDLSTGTVRTWQDANSQDTVSRLSWAQNGHAIRAVAAPVAHQRQRHTEYRRAAAAVHGGLDLRRPAATAARSRAGLPAGHRLVAQGGKHVAYRGVMTDPAETAREPPGRGQWAE